MFKPQMMTRFNTDWPADSIEFCPHPLARKYFVCGTYKLEHSQDSTSSLQIEASEDGAVTSGKPQVRKGKCLLFRIQENDQIELLHKTDLPAILDMKWCHRAPFVSPLLAIADSEGHITLHELENEESRLHSLQTVTCAPSDRLCLSLDWSNRRNPMEGLGDLIVSVSDGSLTLLRPGDDGLVQTDSWHAHDYEPWIAAWDYWNTNVVYSGGDDLKMKGWDVRQGGAQSIFTNKRFGAGVTTIQSHPHVENILAVGSYDNSVCLFDVRKPLEPLMQVDVGGGAWRVKWHPAETRKNDILVACMHDGFKVIHRFDDHMSLAYGVDWSFAEDAHKSDTVVASCSFYDHTLHLWRA